MESESVTEEGLRNENNEEVIPDISSEPNPFWRKNAEKIIGESISSIEDTAKQFVVITGLLQGIYFHAITFSDIKSANGYLALIYMAPLILWFLSLIFASMVLLRKRYKININSSSDSKEKFEKIVKIKYRYIQIAGVLLVLSFLALAITVLHYMCVFPVRWL